MRSANCAGDPEQVGAEHTILHRDGDRQPVRWQHPVAAPKFTVNFLSPAKSVAPIPPSR